MKLSVFWFRRDLRLEDNTALQHALNSGSMVLPIFIFDQNILASLPANDPRVSFIYETLESINAKLQENGSGVQVFHGDPLKVWQQLITVYDIGQVYINKDYEPCALERDGKLRNLLCQYGIILHAFKDQVIFEESDIVKNDGKPYTVYTPYKKKWLQYFYLQFIKPPTQVRYQNFYPSEKHFPTMVDIGFKNSHIKVRDYNLSRLGQYAAARNMPAEDATSYLGPHLRFGTVSIRQVITQLQPEYELFLSELIWREFFMQILYHFPQVVNRNFKVKYDGIVWRNNTDEFERWCHGQTGYPLVDAGMRQLNATGYMHNRVRMVAAGFLCKHLLIDWRWGEAYFAKKLLDYELSFNNGNWQWAAGTGCDAAPYFRVFNPSEQLKKFDKNLHYVKKWVPEYGTSDYTAPIVEHKLARTRALVTYKSALLTKYNRK
jgi:deoxyribodipyrimidine photo-lyase